MQWTEQLPQLVGALAQRYGTFRKMALKRWCEWQTMFWSWREAHR